jgi:hypothetical protein
MNKRHRNVKFLQLKLTSTAYLTSPIFETSQYLALNFSYVVQSASWTHRRAQRYAGIEFKTILFTRKSMENPTEY